MKTYFYYMSLLAISLSFSSSVAAFEDSQCFSPQYSTAGTGDCLDKEYKAVDAELKKKVAQLIKAVSKSHVWSTQPNMAKAYKAGVISSIQQADKNWRDLTKTECLGLVSALYTGGSGEGNAGVDCSITRTRERIKYIQENEAYKDHWSR